MNRNARFWRVGIMVLAGVAVLGWVVMALWNSLLPSLFAGVREIGYFQALGLLLLSKILFGGFHGRCAPGERWSRWHQQRLERMTPEEREQFQSGMRFGWCRKPGRDES